MAKNKVTTTRGNGQEVPTNVCLFDGVNDSVLGGTANPMTVTLAAGSGGDASAANQVLQITQETALNTVLGTVTASPTANTVSDRLKTINTTLGSAATAAKQPALGTAGTASADVITVQGIASGVPVFVQGNVAHDGAYGTQNPVPVGGYASASAPTAVQTGDISRQWYTLVGAAVAATVVTAANADGISNASTGFAQGINVSTTASLSVFPSVYNGLSWDRAVKPNATSRLISSAASTNATSAKASAGNIHMLTGRNTALSVIYLKTYNKASAPTVGTDTPRHTFAIPPGNFVIEWPKGCYFATGIAYAYTTGSADNDTGAIAAGDILGHNLDYS